MSNRTTNLALLRMKKAHEAGRGVRLSHEELRAFSVELIGEWWESITEDGDVIDVNKDGEAKSHE